MLTQYEWMHTIGTVIILSFLEAVLSADNAVVIAALVAKLDRADWRQRALNWGLLLALILRVLAIVLVVWLVRYSQIQLIGGLYLIWLAFCYFRDQLSDSDLEAAPSEASPLSLSWVILLVAITDLCFSLDSVAAAVALTDNLWLVILGAAIGLAILRFLTGFVMNWMKRFERLQDAAYLAVLSVGLRLIAKTLWPELAPSEPVLLMMFLVFFGWGFSKPAIFNPEEPPISSPAGHQPSSGIGV